MRVVAQLSGLEAMLRWPRKGIGETQVYLKRGRRIMKTTLNLPTVGMQLTNHQVEPRPVLEVTGDLQVCVVAGIVMIQTRRAVKPSDGRGAWESAVFCRCWLELDFQENVYGHADEFEKVLDFLVTVQYTCLRDPNAPGSAAGVPAADAVR
jgi:hypothetical protein